MTKSYKIDKEISYRSLLKKILNFLYGKEKPISAFYRIVFYSVNIIAILSILWNFIGAIAMYVYASTDRFSSIDSYLERLALTYGFDQPIITIYNYYLMGIITWFIIFVSGFGNYRMKSWGPILIILTTLVRLSIIMFTFNLEYLIYEVQWTQKGIWLATLVLSLILLIFTKRHQRKQEEALSKSIVNSIQKQ